LVRSLVGFLENLSKRVDCRVDDFRGIGLYALLQDGETFYLLTSREGRARVRTARGFEALSSREIRGVKELSVESSRAQKELFSQDLKDFLALYKIEAVGDDGVMMPVDFSLGGSGEEMDTLVDALDQPGVIQADVKEKTIPLNLISDKMMFVRFDGLVRARDLYGFDGIERRGKSVGRRTIRVAFPLVAALAVATVGGVWLSERLARPPGETTPTEVVRSSQPAGEDEIQPVSQSAPVEAADAPADEKVDEETRFGFAVEWDKSYSRPVTSTPAFSGNRVFFGSRDRNLYALDRETGDLAWRYRAADGIGASPAVSGNRIIGADYKGNVFALGVADGKVIWTRKLPGKVVSSPSVGDGEVVVGCYDGTAYALSTETGRVMWRLKTGGRVRGTSAYQDGRFFVPSYDGRLYAVTAGTVAWRANLQSQLESSPDVEGDRVVVGAANGRIYGLQTATGEVEWSFGTGAAVKSFVTVSGGKVYVGSNDKSLYCLNMKDGTLVWKAETSGPVLGRAALTGDHVIFPSYDGYVYCVDAANGSTLDRFHTGGPVFSSPAVVDGHAYFGNNSGKFYCLNLSGGESS
jgi:outer membrane protein assembly factor BamB